jgi:phosphatidylserine/phosphatidylglycerophosphate/cardiolipin synthase-like enzyme
VNTALRAVHEALRRTGEPVEVWRRVIDATLASARRSHLDPAGAAAALRTAGVRVPAGEWMAHLRQLGVVGVDGALDRQAAADVAVALRLVADSFAEIGPRSTWRPVVTLPSELRPLMRAPPLPQTAGVVVELLERARIRVDLAAPFADLTAVEFLTPSLLHSGRKGVGVHILTSQDATPAFAGLLGRWPGEAGGPLHVTEVTTGLSPLGSHAKVAIVDGEIAYIGSANLTAAGLGRQIEIGVEVTGPQVADLERLLVAVARLGATTFAFPLRAGA